MVLRRVVKKVLDKAEDVVLGKAERDKQELEKAAEDITKKKGSTP